MRIFIKKIFVYKQFAYIFAKQFETNKTMSKNKQKKPYQSYNPLIIKKLKEKYGLTTQFIQQSLRGDRKSETSEKICQDYKLIDKELNKTIKTL